LFGPERGDEVLILSATVRAHSSYNGQDQTVLERVKIDDFDLRASRFYAQLFHWTYTDEEIVERGYFKKGEMARLHTYREDQLVQFPELAAEVAEMKERRS
jgi:hypothetical protein